VIAICQHAPSSPSRRFTPHRPAERYQRRRPEKAPLYRLIARHLETWLTERTIGQRPVAEHVEEEFRENLRCVILCFGFA